MKTFLSITFCSLFLSITSYGQYIYESSSNDKVSTKYQTGYVILPDGKKLVGKIQLHIKSGDTLKVHIKTINKDKFKYDRAEISSFGLELTKEDFKKEDFFPGQITLVDGTLKNGNIAVSTDPINRPKEINMSAIDSKSISTTRNGLGDYSPPSSELKCSNTELPENADNYTSKWSYQTVYFEDHTGRVTPYYASHICKVTINKDEKTIEWVRYANGLYRVLSTGRFTLIHDPYPEVYSESKTAAAQQKQTNFGKSLANSNQSASSTQNQMAIGAATTKVTPQFDDEWIIINQNGEAFELNSKTFKVWMEANIESCPAYKERKNKLTLKAYSEAQKIVEFLNKNCAN